MSSNETLAAQWTTCVIERWSRASSVSAIPRFGLSMSPSTKTNFFAFAPEMPRRFRRRAPALLRRQDLQDLLRLRVADRLGPDDADDALDPPVARGLEENLLAEKARRARQEDLELRAAAAGPEKRAGVALELLDRAP